MRKIRQTLETVNQILAILISLNFKGGLYIIPCSGFTEAQNDDDVYDEDDDENCEIWRQLMMLIILFSKLNNTQQLCIMTSIF